MCNGYLKLAPVHHKQNCRSSNILLREQLVCMSRRAKACLFSSPSTGGIKGLASLPTILISPTSLPLLILSQRWPQGEQQICLQGHRTCYSCTLCLLKAMREHTASIIWAHNSSPSHLGMQWGWISLRKACQLRQQLTLTEETNKRVRMLSATQFAKMPSSF